MGKQDKYNTHSKGLISIGKTVLLLNSDKYMDKRIYRLLVHLNIHGDCYLNAEKLH